MKRVIVHKIPVGEMGTNCYIVENTITKEALVIDPGAEEEKIANELSRQGLYLNAVLLTHGHFDHILEAGELARKLRAKIYASEEERVLLGDAEMNCSMRFGRECTLAPDEVFRDGEQVVLAGMQFTVIHTPGHTRGSICFYFEEQKLLFSGDTLFFNSLGRTDLPTGNAGLIIETVKKKLLVLPDAVIVYPGHGNDTTIGYEKRNNPYLGEEGYWNT